MERGSPSTVVVTFPADGRFGRISRVTVGGLALRAGVGVAETERLRDAVDAAATALGPEGRIRLRVDWDTAVLLVSMQNDEAAVDDPAGLRAALTPLVTGIDVATHVVSFAAG